MKFEVLGMSQPIGWGSPIDWSISHFCLSKNAKDQSIDAECQSIGSWTNFQFSKSVSSCNCLESNVNRLALQKFPFLQNRKKIQSFVGLYQSIGFHQNLISSNFVCVTNRLTWKGAQDQSIGAGSFLRNSSCNNPKSHTCSF